MNMMTKIKKALFALVATVLTIVFILALMYVELKHTHGLITSAACMLSLIGAMWIFFYTMFIDW